MSILGWVWARKTRNTQGDLVVIFPTLSLSLLSNSPQRLCVCVFTFWTHSCFPLGLWGTFAFYKFLALWQGTSINLKMKVLYLIFLRWSLYNQPVSIYVKSISACNKFETSPNLICLKYQQYKTNISNLTDLETGGVDSCLGVCAHT